MATKGQPIEVTESSNDKKEMTILFYGATGAGKSRAMASAALCRQMSPMFIIDADKSLESVTWKVAQAKVSNAAQLEEALQLAISGKFKTVGLDTLTEIYQILLTEAVRQDGLVAKMRGRDFDEDVPDQHAYMKAHSAFRRMMRTLRDKPIHLIATAQETWVMDEVQDKVIGRGPHITGKLNSQIGQFFSIIGHLEVGREKLTELHTEAQYQTISKDRKHIIPGVLEIPEMQDLMTEIYGYYYPTTKKQGGK